MCTGCMLNNSIQNLICNGGIGVHLGPFVVEVSENGELNKSRGREDSTEPPDCV